MPGKLATTSVRSSLGPLGDLSYRLIQHRKCLCFTISSTHIYHASEFIGDFIKTWEPKDLQLPLDLTLIIPIYKAVHTTEY